MKYFKLSIMICLWLIVFSCKKDDCEDTICLNGGVCKSGDCDCPDGYEGANCGDQETPLKITIHSVRVTRFPVGDNGANWDILDGPDIYFQIFAGNNLLFEQPNFIEDANPTLDYDLLQTPIEITNTTGEHTIQLLDYDDFDDDDFMGGIIFTPYWSDTNGFPTTIELDAGAAVAFTLTVSYTW